MHFNVSYNRVDKKDNDQEQTQSNFTPCHKHKNRKGTRTTKTALKIKTTQVKSQGDSSFPADGHMAILNKMNSKSKRTSIDNENKSQQEHRLGTVSNKLLGDGGAGGGVGWGVGGGLNWFHSRGTLTVDSAVVHIHTSYSVHMKDF